MRVGDAATDVYTLTAGATSDAEKWETEGNWNKATETNTGTFPGSAAGDIANLSGGGVTSKDFSDYLSANTNKDTIKLVTSGDFTLTLNVATNNKYFGFAEVAVSSDKTLTLKTNTGFPADENKLPGAIAQTVETGGVKSTVNITGAGFAWAQAGTTWTIPAGGILSSNVATFFKNDLTDSGALTVKFGDAGSRLAVNADMDLTNGGVINQNGHDGYVMVADGKTLTIPAAASLTAGGTPTLTKLGTGTLAFTTAAPTGLIKLKVGMNDPATDGGMVSFDVSPSAMTHLQVYRGTVNFNAAVNTNLSTKNAGNSTLTDGGTVNFNLASTIKALNNGGATVNFEGNEAALETLKVSGGTVNFNSTVKPELSTGATASTLTGGTVNFKATSGIKTLNNGGAEVNFKENEAALETLKVSGGTVNFGGTVKPELSTGTTASTLIGGTVNFNVASGIKALSNNGAVVTFKKAESALESLTLKGGAVHFTESPTKLASADISVGSVHISESLTFSEGGTLKFDSGTLVAGENVASIKAPAGATSFKGTLKLTRVLASNNITPLTISNISFTDAAVDVHLPKASFSALTKGQEYTVLKGATGVKLAKVDVYTYPTAPDTPEKKTSDFTISADVTTGTVIIALKTDVKPVDPDPVQPDPVQPGDDGKFNGQEITVPLPAGKTLTGISDVSELTNNGITVTLKGNKLVLNGDPNDTGTFEITLKLSDNTLYKVTVIIKAVQKEVDTLVDNRPGVTARDWLLKLTDSKSFELKFPITVPTASSAKVTELLPLVITGGTPTGNPEIKTSSAETKATDASGTVKTVIVKGTVTDIKIFEVKTIKYRIGALEYVQNANVKAVDMKQENESPDIPVTPVGGSGGGCNAGNLGLIIGAAAALSLAILRKRS